jgi:hypothetical protein
MQITPARLALLVPVALVGAFHAAAPARAAEDVVRFRFKWPASLKADVAMARSRLQTGKPDDVLSLRFVRDVRRDGEEIVITDRKTTWAGKLPASTSPELLRASERVREVADVNGDFLRIDGVKAIRPSLEQVIRARKKELTKAEIDQEVEVAIWVMRFDAEAIWAATVGFWQDQEMTVGETYRMKIETALPVAPSRRFPAELEYGVTRRVPCQAGQKDAKCVELKMSLRIDPRERDRAAHYAAEGLGIEPERIPADAADRLTADSEFTVVTHPATLLPYRLLSVDSVRFREVGPDATTRSFDLRRELSFVYGR